jgi:hypothetical protein
LSNIQPTSAVSRRGWAAIAIIRIAITANSGMRNAAYPRARRQTPKARPYHHGDLRRVLIDAALQLAAEGAEVSVREAARRAAVSPAVPWSTVSPG